MAARRKKPAAKSTGLEVADGTEGPAPAAVEALGKQIASSGGRELARYRDPLGGHWLVLAALPLEAVDPTPYQRELSDSHVKRLTDVIPKVGRFLDPILAVPNGAGFWTPNGMHRLAAMRALGAKAIVALVSPDRELALRILALNTEKAHNLRDKSLEVVRMARALAADPDLAGQPEETWAFEFEEPSYPTIGLCYEQRPRFAGAVYLPVLRRCESFSARPISESLRDREQRATQVLELDEAVNEAVAHLKDAGLKSPYLKAFVVARINPLRFAKPPKVGAESPRASFEATVGRMLASARKFDASKIRPQDVASSGGPMVEE